MTPAVFGFIKPGIALDILSIIALVASATAIGGLGALRAMVRTSRENVEVLEEARKLDRLKCDDKIAALELSNLALQQKVAGLQSNYAVEITGLVLTAISKQVDGSTRALAAGQRELIAHLNEIKAALIARAHEQGANPA